MQHSSPTYVAPIYANPHATDVANTRCKRYLLQPFFWSKANITFLQCFEDFMPVNFLTAYISWKDSFSNIIYIHINSTYTWCSYLLMLHHLTTLDWVKIWKISLLEYMFSYIYLYVSMYVCMHSSTPMCTGTGHIQPVTAFKTNSKCRNMREAHFPHLRTDPMYINVKHVLDSIYFFLEESCSRV